MNQKVIIIENQTVVFSSVEVNPLITNLVKGLEQLGNQIWKEQATYLFIGEIVVSLRKNENKALIIIDKAKINFEEFLNTNGDIFVSDSESK
jgi:hypothetical protein